MRYIDELLAVYPGKDPATRRFILSQLADQALRPGHEQVISLLWNEAVGGLPALSGQARFVLGDALPEYLWARWRLAGSGSRTMPCPPALAEALAHAVTLAGGPEPRLRTAAGCVLGRLHDAASVQALCERAVQTGDAGPVLALAELGLSETWPVLAQAVRARGASEPDVLLAAARLPPERALECLTAVLAGASPAARCSVAQVIGHLPAPAGRSLAEQLIRIREGWLTAYVLDALGRRADPAELPLIQDAWNAEGHEFVRLQAVRAAAACAGASPDAVKFFLECLRVAPRRIQSAALEALAELEERPPELGALARPLLEADFVRTRVQAVLIVAHDDPARVRDEVSRMLVAPEAVLRLEAAYVLGVLHGAGTAPVLERIAAYDPSALVRAEALRSLALHPPALAVPALAEIVASGQAEAAAAAATLGSLSAVAAPLVMERLIAVLPVVAGPSRAAALRALGSAAIGAGLGVPAPLMAALADADPVIRIGALEGVKMAGDALDPDALGALAADPEPRIASRAIVAWMLAGASGAAQALARRLDPAAPEPNRLYFVRALLDVGIALPALVPGSRFGRAAAALAGTIPASIFAPRPARRTVRVQAVRPLVEAPAALDEVSMKWVVEAYRKDVEPLPEQVAPEPSMAGVGLLGGAGKSARIPVPERPPEVPELPVRKLLVAATVVLVTMLEVVSGGWCNRGPAGGSGSTERHVAASGDPGGSALPEAWLCRGEVTRTDRQGVASALAVGEQLRPGDTVSTGSSGQVRLQDGTGAAVELEPRSKVHVEPSGKHGYALEGIAGRCLIDQRRSLPVDVAVAGCALKIRSGSVRVEDSGSGVTATLLDGQGTVSSDMKSIELVVGKPQRLPP